MPAIHLKTRISAPIQRVFDLARSIDLHQDSNPESKEVAIAGKTSGLIELGETVTWKARHFGIYQKLTVKVIELESSRFFTDVMLKGAFKSMKHSHKFEAIDGGTDMTDHFEFESPLGYLGRIANSLFLKSYMTRFLKDKNDILKRIAESEEWEKYV